MKKIDLDYFERVIIYKSLTDEKYLADIISHIEPDLIANKNIKTIFKIIKEFFLKRGAPPNITELKTYLVNDDIKNAFKAVASTFSEIDKNLNKEELLENTERYLKERAIYHTMMDVAEDITAGKVDTSYILERFEKSCRINLKDDIGLDLFKDIDVLVKDLTTFEPVIPTTWPWLDKKLGGGFKSNGRAFYVFAGQTNVGKSIFLGNIAANMCRQGKNVVIISLEMSELMYACRVASDLSTIPIANLKDETVSLARTINNIGAQPTNGKILIKEFPPNTITAQQVDSYIKTVQLQGIHIDAIILDYINLLKGSMNSNLYERIKTASEEVRALTYKFNCPIITATQLNRCIDINSTVKHINGAVKKIKDIKVGDEIYGENQTVIVKKVYPITKQKCYKITTASGKSIICSGIHLFPTANGELKSIESGLSVNDSLLTLK